MDIAHLLGLLYNKSYFIYTFLGLFLSILSFHEPYYQLIGLFFTRKFPPAKNYHKYAVLIPGRNEEKVIGNLIKSIKAQDYPQEYLTIFVCADNCTDNTAAVARENGAVVYEHFNPDERTKGFAVKYLFEQIQKDYGIESFEGYFMFDADNLLKKDYISRMNDSFDAGEKIITSYRNTKNWSESWVVSLYGLHWLRSIRFRHRTRSFLHLATNIQGTGFLFTNEIVRNGWKYTSLTEDRSLTADCVVNGYEISFNYDAIFYDEQPTSIKVALTQRLRWAKGHLQAFAESGWGLFINIFWNKNTKHYPEDKWYHYVWRVIRHRFMAFDTFAQLLPRQIVVTFKWMVWTWLLHSFYVYNVGGKYNLFKNSTNLSKIIHWFTGDVVVNLSPGLKGLGLCLIISIWMRLYYRLGLYASKLWIGAYLFIIERKRIMKISFKRKVLYVLLFPLYDVIEKYVKIIALFKHVEWKPIPHDSKVTIDDISHE